MPRRRTGGIIGLLVALAVLLGGCVGLFRSTAKTELYGIVTVLESGEPIAGAIVTASGKQTTTSADGTFTLGEVAVVRGRVTYRIEAEGFVAISGNVAWDHRARIGIAAELPIATVQGTGQVRGRINFALPGRPWSEEWVDCPELGYDYPFSTASASAVSSGSFRLEPDDPCRPAQHYLDKIDAPRAWAVQTGSPDVVVAVISTGIDSNHPELQDRIVEGVDLIQQPCPWPETPDDCTGLGTGMAGIIGAAGNNGIGVTGVAWNVSLMPVRASRIIEMPPAIVPQALRTAADLGADVIHISFAGVYDDPELAEAVEYALEKGAVLVAVVGLGGDMFPPGYPARYDGVIGVSALAFSSEPEIYDSASIGPGIDLVAPGEDILTTTILIDYAWLNGTDFAAAIVSGVAALMISNGIPHSEVADVLRRTAIWIGDPIENEEDRHRFGYGLVNAYAAVMGVDPMETTLRLLTAEGRLAGMVTSPDDVRRFTLDGVPEGEDLYLLAWIDVDHSGLLDQGDYVALKSIVVDEGVPLAVDLELEVLDADISLNVNAPWFDVDALAAELL